MKRFENSNTWKLALDAIEEFENKEQKYDKLTDDEIEKRCYELASYVIDDKIKNKSDLELRQLENDGEIFNSHLFLRLARHFYLEEVIEEENTLEKRILMETLHAFLGNQYYFDVKNDVFIELCILANEYPRKYDTSIKTDSSINRMAESAVYLKNKGFEIGVKKASIKYDDEVEKNIFSMLDEKNGSGRRNTYLLLDNLIQPWFDLSLYVEKNYKYEEYRKVAEYMLNQKNLLGQVDTCDMKKKTNVARYKIDKILDDISICKRNINLEFTSLEGKVNLYTRPLISYSLNKYIFIDQHFTGIGFYIAAYDMIKEKKSNLDSLQGPIVEKILRDEMKVKGYDYLSGKYKEKSGIKPSDCDVILQGEKINHLVEC